MMLLSGCGGSKEDFERWKQEREASEAAEAKSAEASAQAKRDALAESIVLETVEVPPLGADLRVDLRVPKGAKTLQATEQAVTYSLPLEGGLISIDIHVRAFGEASLDRAKASAMQLGGRIAEAKDEGGKHEVILVPQGILQTVEVYLPDVSVQCKGPKDLLPKLREICGSIATRQS
jgi:hypothetical protein